MEILQIEAKNRTKKRSWRYIEKPQAQKALQSRLQTASGKEIVKEAPFGEERATSHKKTK